MNLEAEILFTQKNIYLLKVNLEKGVWFKTPERPLLQNTSSFLILSEGIGRCSDVFIVKFEIISKLSAVAVGNPASCLALYLFN